MLSKLRKFILIYVLNVHILMCLPLPLARSTLQLATHFGDIFEVIQSKCLDLNTTKRPCTTHTPHTR